LELGDDLPVHKHLWSLALSLSNDRRLGPKGSDLKTKPEREVIEIAAILMSRDYLQEQISQRLRQLMIIHTNDGNAMRAANC
jgi:hypothetical protein